LPERVFSTNSIARYYEYASDICIVENPSVKTVISHTHEAETDIFETRFVKELKGFVTLWRPDVAYDTLELSTPGPRQRLNCYSGGWEYQRS